MEQDKISYDYDDARQAMIKRNDDNGKFICPYKYQPYKTGSIIFTYNNDEKYGFNPDKIDAMRECIINPKLKKDKTAVAVSAVSTPAAPAVTPTIVPTTAATAVALAKKTAAPAVTPTIEPTIAATSLTVKPATTVPAVAPADKKAAPTTADKKAAESTATAAPADKKAEDAEIKSKIAKIKEMMLDEDERKVNANKYKANQECNEYKQGKCKYKDDCLFSHRDTKEITAKKIKRVDDQVQNMKALRQRKAIYIDKDFATMTTSKLMEYIQLYDEIKKLENSINQEKKKNRRNKIEAELKQKKDKLCIGNKGLDTCLDFQLGDCARGEACQFKHVAASTESTDTKAGPDSTECFEFKNKGRCGKGNECKFRHVRPLTSTGGSRGYMYEIDIYNSYVSNKRMYNDLPK